MVKTELGTKRTCPSCAARFYDLLMNPITCPKCHTSYVAAPILPSKGDYASMAAAAPVPKQRDPDEVEDQDPSDVELISLEDVEEDGKDDDETAGIEDVDLGEDAADDGEDDAFLVVEEEEGDSMSGLIDGGSTKEGEEET